MTDAHDESHGNTVAAWTAVVIMIIGTVVGGLAIWFSNIPMFWAGVAIIVVGGITGKVLQAMGYGQTASAKASA